MVLGGAGWGWHQIGRGSCRVGGHVDSEFEFHGSWFVVCIGFGNYRPAVRYLLDEVSGFEVATRTLSPRGGMFLLVLDFVITLPLEVRGIAFTLYALFRALLTEWLKVRT